MSPNASRQSTGKMTNRPLLNSEKVFVSQERVSGFPEKGADFRGSPATSGEVWGTSGEVWETSGDQRIAIKFHSERTSGEVSENFRGSSGEVRGLPRRSGELDSLPVTRQICLQFLPTYTTPFQHSDPCHNFCQKD